MEIKSAEPVWRVREEDDKIALSFSAECSCFTTEHCIETVKQLSDPAWTNEILYDNVESGHETNWVC